MLSSVSTMLLVEESPESFALGSFPHPAKQATTSAAAESERLRLDLRIRLGDMSGIIAFWSPGYGEQFQWVWDAAYLVFSSGLKFMAHESGEFRADEGGLFQLGREVFNASGDVYC